MSLYALKPERFLERLYSQDAEQPVSDLFCAGFELGQWRCSPFALHLVEWLPDYALIEEELQTNHANAFVKLRQAALRVYTSAKYQKRGEAGEIALHAICRDFFDTIPISPRVFYKSTSNDVVKSFDMVHARFPTDETFELWLGESKLYNDPAGAVSEAIASIRDHIEKGFLTNQKLILGPQIPRTTPHYDQIIQLFKSQTSLDKLISSAVFVVGIFCDSAAAQSARACSKEYVQGAIEELNYLAGRLKDSGLCTKLRILLVYVPLANKAAFVTDFDQRLKGLQ